jgi:Xaa-Pro aminopeptidase
MSDASTRADRLARLRAAMQQADIGLAAIAPTDTLRWLAGAAPLYDERACLLLVTAGATAMLMPSLNAEQTAERMPEIELVRWADEDGPEAALRSALERVGAPSSGTLAADPLMRADHLLVLCGAVPGLRAIDGAALVGPLREIKDATELATLQRSSDIADRAVQAAWDACAPGVTELQIADAIAGVFSAAGAQPEFALVGSGPNGAFPHHETGARVLRDGDAIVIDLGGVLEGYHSDITRMAFVGEPTERYREVHATVEAAVVAAMAATRPGATCGEVDAAARGVIADAGYGEYFVHRTGHGLGVSGHEPPWVMDGSDAVLAAGMVHSIEPGIYLPGDFGVRLEDIVTVTESGCERFSALARDVHVARG